MRIPAREWRTIRYAAGDTARRHGRARRYPAPAPHLEPEPSPSGLTSPRSAHHAVTPVTQVTCVLLCRSSDVAPPDKYDKCTKLLVSIHTKPPHAPCPHGFFQPRSTRSTNGPVCVFGHVYQRTRTRNRACQGGPVRAFGHAGARLTRAPGSRGHLGTRAFGHAADADTRARGSRGRAGDSYGSRDPCGSGGAWQPSR